MLIDWQNIAVLLIVLAALGYVGRRGWARLRSFRARGANDAACAAGCGSCGPGPGLAQPAGARIVQIERAGGGRRSPAC